MLTVEEALQEILRNVHPEAETEEIVTLYSAGKILAAPVVSPIQVPPLDNSQMDGYAVRSSEFADGRLEFPVSEKIYAGHMANLLRKARWPEFSQAPRFRLVLTL